jgi:hypothetical protein
MDSQLDKQQNNQIELKIQEKKKTDNSNNNR